ncbi:hypothetical protein [Methanoculleus sp.]|uniref:hypothetical protein n=1 Tax=Methanoculleus sp. TaxID=90427 RepID=UPI001BD229B3|nr:hypothetical protein [Methanoculleus sp.]
MAKYGELCRALLGASYTPATVYQYLTEPPGGRTVVLRHDVDRKPENALKMAELEHALGVTSTYYFRHPYTFIPEIIEQVLSLGHEVGYHYEVLAKAKGDYEKAIGLFARELEEFRSLCDVRTICMHGSPLSRYDNRDLWKEYDFREFGIAGEAYLSMAGNGLCYLTDTGRTWGAKHSMRDAMPGAGAAPPSVATTDDLARWIGSAGEEGLYLTVHPERWAVDRSEWLISYSQDAVANFGKSILIMVQ